MRMNDDGFSTPFAMTVIFSLSIFALSLSLLITATGKKIGTYKNHILAQKEADSIIFNLEDDFQSFKNDPCDSGTSAAFVRLLKKYSEYDLSLEDASTGINRNFFPEKFYESDGIKDYVAFYSDDSFVDYGWVNSKYASKETLESIASDFGEEKVFPIVNSYPLLNIYSMSCDFLRAILEYCGIKDADEKSIRLKEFLYHDLEQEEMSRLLDIEPTDSVFDFLGTKTVFWKAKFETQRCRAEAIIALVPKKDNPRSIDSYRLIEKKIFFKGENSCM